MTQPPTDPLRAFAELVHVKLSETDFDGVCERAADLAREVITAADEASVVIMRDGRSLTAAATGYRSRRLDSAQRRSPGGPALQAAAEASTVSVSDTTRDERWPGWAAEAADAGLHSVLSIGLPIDVTVNGALTLYSETPGAFGESAVELAQAFAGYATVALANAHLYSTTADLAENMRRAMEHRGVIEQAKGFVMAERRCTADEAFAVLLQISQDTNRKLRDVAAALVERNSAPAPAAPGPVRRRPADGRPDKGRR